MFSDSWIQQRSKRTSFSHLQRQTRNVYHVGKEGRSFALLLLLLLLFIVVVVGGGAKQLNAFILELVDISGLRTPAWLQTRPLRLTQTAL